MITERQAYRAETRAQMRHELRTQPFRIALLFAVTLGSPILLKIALAKYPPLDPDVGSLRGILIAVYLLSLAIILWRRDWLFAFAKEHMITAALLSMALAIIPVFAAGGTILFANGWLDHSPPYLVTTIVNGSYKAYMGRHGMVSHPDQVSLTIPPDTSGRIFIDLSDIDRATVLSGSQIILSVKKGAFGLPWIGGHAHPSRPPRPPDGHAYPPLVPR